MMQPLPRASLGAIAGATLLSLALVSAAAAQVATLADPAEDAEATPDPAVELDGEEALLEFAQCMRENGIEMDDPQFGAGGGRFGFGGPGGGADPAIDLQSDTFQGAMEACDGLLMALAPAINAAEQAERAEQQLAVAQCMRDAGYDFPDPATGGGFGAQLRFLEDAGIDPTDPTFQADISTCQADAGFEPGRAGGAGGVAE
jgi:hypothetical protein